MDCQHCAQLIRIHTCEGNKEECTSFIDYRANCRRCKYVKSCKTLGKKVGILHVCVNFERGTAPFPDLESFDDYEQFKERKRQKTKNQVIADKKLEKLEKLKYADKQAQKLDFNPLSQPEDWSPELLVDKIINSEYDPRVFNLINEGDIVKPTNIVQFMIEPHFMNVPLFPRQLQIALNYFAAYCPYCSDTNYIRNKIKVNTNINNILDRVVFYVNGKCPKCGKTRYDAIKDKMHYNYSTFVGLCGQRCVHGSTLITTDKGIFYMKDIAILHKNTLGFQKYMGPNLVLENGLIVKASKFYTSDKEYLYEILFKDGKVLRCTKDHPIMTHLGMVPLKNLDKNEYYIPIYVNQQSWGNKLLDFSDLNKSITKKYIDKNANQQQKCFIPKFGYTQITEDLAKLLGFYIAEGYRGRITNFDKTILHFCQSQLNKLYGLNIEANGTIAHCKSSPATLEHFNELLDYNIFIIRNNKRIFTTSKDRHIPRHILTSPRNIVCAFLQALFEGDGGMEANSVTYCSLSHKLIIEVSSLLSNLGIFHKVFKFKTFATNGSENQVSKNAWKIEISGSLAVNRFKKYIDFFSERKKKLLVDVISFYKNRQVEAPHWYEKYPQFVKDKFLSILHDIDEYLKQFNYLYKNGSHFNHLSPKNLSIVSIFDRNSDVKRIYADNVSLTKIRIRNTNRVLTSSKFWRLLPQSIRNNWLAFNDEFSNENMYYTSIINIKKSSKKMYSYDFTVPSHHRFLSNGILSSNSGKSVTHGIFAAAVLAQYLCLPNPVSFMKQLDSVTFRMTFVGLRYADAYENLWQDFYNNITQAPWFKMYNQFLTEEGIRLGQNLFRIKDSYAIYTIKGLAAIPAGPDRRKLRGRCLIGNTLVHTNFGCIKLHKLGNLLRLQDVYIRCKDDYFRIVEFSYQGKKKTVRILLDNGLELTASEDHRIPVVDSSNKITLVQAKNIKNKYVLCQLNSKNYNVDLDYSDKLFILLGLITRVSQHTSNKFTLVTFSRYLFEEINDLMQEVFNCNTGYIDNDKCIIGIPDELKVFFKEDTSYDIRTLPEIIYTASKRQIILYLKALLLDNDILGWRRYNKSYLTFNNNILAKNIQQLLFSLGYYCSRYNNVVTMNVKENYALCNEIFDLHFSCIKQNESNIQYYSDNVVICKVDNVFFGKEKPVYDIGIDSEDHLFAANGILVHNTRLWSSMDEVGHFTGKDGSMTLDADEVALALDNSLTTLRTASSALLPRYPDVPNAHAFYISSPRAKLDKIMRLYKQSKVIDSYYGIKAATWEFNPNISKETLKDRFIADPIGAERDFGANPPFGEDLYISNAADIVDILSKKKNAIRIERYKTAKDSLGGSVLYPIISVSAHSHASILACDCGYSYNSYALALMHKIQYEDEDTGEVTDIIACSGILEIQPKEGIPLSFPKIYEQVICKIIENFDVKMVAVDRWQSINLRQSVYDDYGIDAMQYSVTMDDFTALKEDIISGQFIIPKLEQDIQEIISLEKDLQTLIQNKPISHFLIQLLTSKDNGRIITKGDETSDDILRAVCLGHSILRDEQFDEVFESDGEQTEGIQNASLGVAVNSSGSIMNTNGNSVSTVPGIGCSISLR